MSLDEFVTKGSSFNYADSHHKHAELRRRELTMESEILDNDRERNEIEKGEKKAFDQIEFMAPMLTSLQVQVMHVL